MAVVLSVSESNQSVRVANPHAAYSRLLLAPIAGCGSRWLLDNQRQIERSIPRDGFAGRTVGVGNTGVLWRWINAIGCAIAIRVASGAGQCIGIRHTRIGGRRVGAVRCAVAVAVTVTGRSVGVRHAGIGVGWVQIIRANVTE